jgi:hypothetical protein
MDLYYKKVANEIFAFKNIKKNRKCDLGGLHVKEAMEIYIVKA